MHLSDFIVCTILTIVIGDVVVVVFIFVVVVFVTNVFHRGPCKPIPKMQLDPMGPIASRGEVRRPIEQNRTLLKLYISDHSQVA